MIRAFPTEEKRREFMTSDDRRDDSLLSLTTEKGIGIRDLNYSAAEVTHSLSTRSYILRSKNNINTEQLQSSRRRRESFPISCIIFHTTKFNPSQTREPFLPVG